MSKVLLKYSPSYNMSNIKSEKSSHIFSCLIENSIETTLIAVFSKSVLSVHIKFRTEMAIRARVPKIARNKMFRTSKKLIYLLVIR